MKNKKLSLLKKIAINLSILCLISMCLSLASFAQTSDYYGVLLPVGGGIDIGAIEYVSGDSQTVVDPTISQPQQNYCVNSENYSNYQFAGTATGESEVEVYSNNVLIGTTNSSSDGSWTLYVDFSPVDEGDQSVIVQSAGRSSEILSGVLTKTYAVCAPKRLRVVATN